MIKQDKEIFWIDGVLSEEIYRYWLHQNYYGKGDNWRVLILSNGERTTVLLVVGWSFPQRAKLLRKCNI